MALLYFKTKVPGTRRSQSQRRRLKARCLELTRLIEHDELTGLFNKKKFVHEMHDLLQTHREEHFVLLWVHVDRLRLLESYFGIKEASALLCYLAESLNTYANAHQPAVCGRIEESEFALCCKLTNQEAMQTEITNLQENVRQYNASFDISTYIGIYRVVDRDASVERMLECAAVAAQSTIFGNSITNAFYTEEMEQKAQAERELVSDMEEALQTEQFRILIQPRFDLRSGALCGGEALVRWHHPVRGVISPGVFVPLFEKNGLIMRLDYIVWEQVCQKLAKWQESGSTLHPVSVNVSKVNLNNPRIVEQIVTLTERYALPPRLLQLELTEGAYTDNPIAMGQIVSQLRSHGFEIMMDDFGNGCAPLKILKEIELDAIKINMAEHCSSLPDRSENVIASVVRMAKWLELPVVAEGVETRDQVEFLRSIGCDYAQGFFYSYPLDPANYIALKCAHAPDPEAFESEFDINSLWAGNSQMEMLFAGAPQAAALYEYDDRERTLDCLRANRMFGEMFGYADTSIDNNPVQNAVPESKMTLMEAANAAFETRHAAECEYLRRGLHGENRWISLKLKYISSVGNRHILLGSFFDITAYKEIELELFKFRSAIADLDKPAKKMLVVDDQKINRDILRKIFSPEFTVLEAAGGEEALQLLREPDGIVDVILLDMLMPGMNGETFLKIKQADEQLEQIPVIIVTAEESAEKQINMLAIGAYDYVVKPLIPEVIRRRVYNVMESSHRFRAMLLEYQQIARSAKEDPLTRVYNRAAAEEKITHLLESGDARQYAMVMIDIDDYKLVNDTYGHNCGDLVLMEFGNKLGRYFRAGDIVARMGGDEFCVLMVGMPSDKTALSKCLEMCNSIRGYTIGEQMVRISCSAGVAMSEPGISFSTLYQRADAALYQAKQRNKGSAVLYAPEE